MTDLAELDGLLDALRRYGLEILAVRYEQAVEDNSTAHVGDRTQARTDPPVSPGSDDDRGRFLPF